MKVYNHIFKEVKKCQIQRGVYKQNAIWYGLRNPNDFNRIIDHLSPHITFEGRDCPRDRCMYIFLRYILITPKGREYVRTHYNWNELQEKDLLSLHFNNFLKEYFSNIYIVDFGHKSFIYLSNSNEVPKDGRRGIYTEEGCEVQLGKFYNEIFDFDFQKKFVEDKKSN